MSLFGDVYGVQTCFRAPIAMEELVFLQQQRFTLGRIDAQDCLPDVVLGIVEDHLQAGLLPYVTVDSLEMIDALATFQALVLLEWRNEPDIALGRPAPIPPEIYASEFITAAARAASHGRMIGGPVVSNLNTRGTRYITAFLAACGHALPDNAFGAVHRYGDGTFQTPHYGKWWYRFTGGPFQNREDEYAWVHDQFGDRSIFVSEFGYPTLEGISEDQQAEYIRQEWDLAQRMRVHPIVFQIHDGPESIREHRYGLRRCDAQGQLGAWKPSAFTVPGGV